MFDLLVCPNNLFSPWSGTNYRCKSDSRDSWLFTHLSLKNSSQVITTWATWCCYFTSFMPVYNTYPDPSPVHTDNTETPVSCISRVQLWSFFGDRHTNTHISYSGSPDGNTATPCVKPGTQYISISQWCPPHPSHTPLSKSTNTHMHTVPQRVMDLSRCSPLSACNKAFHACSLRLFGPWSIKPMPRCQNLLTSRPRGHAHQYYVYAYCSR